MTVPARQILDVTPTGVTFAVGDSRPVTASLDEIDAALRKVQTGPDPEVQVYGLWVNESDLLELRAAILRTTS